MPPSEPTTDVLVGAIGEPPPPEELPRRASRWGVPLLFTAGSLLCLGSAAIATVSWSLRDPRSVPGVTVAGAPFGKLDRTDAEQRFAALAETDLQRSVIVKVADHRVEVRRADLGVRVEKEPVLAALFALGHSGDPALDLTDWWRARRGLVEVPLRYKLDRSTALNRLSDLKEDFDRAPKDAKLDLDRHTIASEEPGLSVDLYASLDRVETAARRGDREVELAVQRVAPKIASDALRGLEIGTILGRWETRYSSTGADSDRTFNLKVGASKLDGHVLQPHEVFSFNQTVGDRTEKEGYRVAPVISAGELIDGLAGGMCQIATTLHAAAFFAGLDIVESRPHSRPSAYITLGLDSTVVYPSVDLKLRNPYDFPVVMHYTVNQGAVKVELLGKERPYDVVFEREIKTETAFGHQSRRDPTAKAGQKLVLQAGSPGYTLARRRYLFEAGKAPTKLKAGETIAEASKRQKLPWKAKNEWSLGYPSTVEIVAIGSGPAKMKPKDPPPAHRIPPVPETDKPLFHLAK